MTDTPSEKKTYGDRYEIQRKIARGGMADVFLARDKLLDRPVALKVLFPELSTDQNFVERFRREAQNAAKLSHPNIVSVYDWGEDASTYFIVMEYVSGKSLSATLHEQGPMSPEKAAEVAAEVAAALSFAHKNDVVHRDVKPGNVLIDTRGAVKVADFGIARARNSTENLTQTGAVMGTATYFSPEQAQGLSVDQRSDVYSLGVVLYEMVSGKPPFQGENPVSIAYKHVSEQPKRLRELNDSISPDFESVVMQALSKSPGNRYQNADELKADLDRFRNGEPVHATQIAPTGTVRSHTPQRSMEDAYADSLRTIPSAPRAQRPDVKSSSPGPSHKGIAVPLMVFVSILAAIAIGAIVLFGGGFNRQVDHVNVPNVVGKKVQDAQDELAKKKLGTTVVKESNEQAENTVIAQDPGEGANVLSTQRITLTVSSGPAPSQLPDVTNLPIETAKKNLQKLGVTVVTTEVASDVFEKDRVIKQDPQSGESVKKGDRVTLTVSSGPQLIEVPNVEGYTLATAAETLSEAGLRTSFPSGVAQNSLVESSDPSPGTRVPKGTTITLSPRSSSTTTTTIIESGSGTTTTSTTTP